MHGVRLFYIQTNQTCTTSRLQGVPSVPSGIIYPTFNSLHNDYHSVLIPFNHAGTPNAGGGVSPLLLQQYLTAIPSALATPDAALETAAPHPPASLSPSSARTLQTIQARYHTNASLPARRSSTSRGIRTKGWSLSMTPQSYSTKASIDTMLPCEGRNNKPRIIRFCLVLSSLHLHHWPWLHVVLCRLQLCAHRQS